ncbi:MAG: hypothetical protein ALECFALPRED_001902 [Alectoria fallacina]|uniref:Uncharacterized protein n=1 Tax=Alectoria fallacina TaxID=1903189 RepID=A0A8H3I5V4_9LECA|nr:MAG: hypothetical protein ALECFALPRED_001902 [Alectoria fallacina]
MAASDLAMANFNSLPRELRDQIYGQLLVSPLPIQFSNVLGPMICDPDFLGPTAMLFEWASNGRIADEACEIFYKCNTFSVHCEDLPSFLGAKIHKMLSIDVSRFMHKQEPTCIRSFNTKEWVTNMNVVVEQDNMKDSRYLGYELRYLLECPRLQKLTIKTVRTTVMSWENEWTGVLKELRLKIGKGLKVIYAKPWLDLAYPRPIQDFGSLSPEPVWEEGDEDSDEYVEVGAGE